MDQQTSTNQSPTDRFHVSTFHSILPSPPQKEKKKKTKGKKEKKSNPKPL